VEET
jgi:hypothetical protein